MKFKTFLASEYVTLDSDVHTGGGTDATSGLQALLDLAGDDCGVHLIMDGAALITGLDVSSNTTIECLSRDCGFFLAPQSHRAVITNKIWDSRSRQTRNVTLVGGTYNQDCANEPHDVEITKPLVSPAPPSIDDTIVRRHWLFGLEFYGVENLTIRDLTVRDFRTFAVMVGGFRNVLIENVWLDLPGHRDCSNQDGFHFWGPGEFLTIKNVGGRVGDDFMNLGPDENDGISSITDVLIDGVFLEHADQAIRMLSHGTGKLDRVTVRNVSGTYRSFGFFINSWFTGDTFGDFGNLFFENIDLRQEEPNYKFRDPMLFSIGGNIGCMTMKNIRHHLPSDKRTLFEIGTIFGDINYKLDPNNLPKMKNFIIEDLTIIEDGESAKDAEYIQLWLPVDNLILRDIYVVRENCEKSGYLMTFKGTGRLGRLMMNNVIASGFKKLIDGEEKIGRTLSNNVVAE